MQVEHEPNEKPAAKVDWLTIFSNLAAAAILLPLGWWLKVNYAHAWGEWTLSWF